MRRLTVLALLGGILMAGTLMAATTYHVAPTGRDENPGTKDRPFATLERARQAVRDLKRQEGLPRGGVTVMLASGTYARAASFELTAEDSGGAGRPVVYQAAPGAEVRLTGARSLPAEAFTPLTDQAILSRLAPEMRGKVFSLDLASLDLKNLPTYPDKYRGAPAVPELFYNDQRMTVARWPNAGWAKIARIIQTGSIPRTGDKGSEPGIFAYAEDAPGRWQVDEGVWLQGYWCFDWFDETIRVKALDPATKQITLAAPTLYGVKQGNPSPRRYKALNVLEELTEPGEYYLDRVRHRLYFYPPGPLAGARLSLSLLNAPVVKLTEVDDVVLRGLVVEDSQGAGIAVAGGRRVSLEACEVRNVREVGIRVEGGSDHHLDACDIHHTGTGGVVLSGGDRKTLTPCRHEAVNCHVWRYSQHQLTYANAFLLSGVGTRVAHCLIHDAPHQAIGVHGNDHVFEYNVVHHICTETDDCGAYYKGRNPSCRGNVVRYNFFHNIGSPMGHGNAAVYFDDGDGGDQVIGNLFFRCGDPGKGSFGTVFSHGGFDLLAQDNIFLECKRPLGSAPWNYKRYMDFLQDPNYRKLLTQEVDITSAAYVQRYPELAGFLDMPESRPRVSQATRNVLSMCASVNSGNWQVPAAENWITAQDPGFVDAARGDFRLRPDAPVFKSLPGFQAPPFAQMGLYRSDLRPAPPVEPWTYGAPQPLEPLSKTVAAAPAVKKGPAPVFQVSRVATPPTLDGRVDAAEYGGGKTAQVMLLAQDVMGSPATRTSRAWLAYDDKALYVAVDNAIHPNTKLDGNQWGTHDAIEIAVLKPVPGKTGPIHVLRGYGNGRLEFGSAPNASDEPLTMDPGPIVYKVTLPEPGRWIAEVSLPWAMLDLDPKAVRKVHFSLAVRKAADDLWLMWEGTRGHSYDAAQAGFLEFGD